MSISNLEDNRMKADTTGTATKIKANKNNSGIYIYPNPAKNRLVIVSDLIENNGLDIQIINSEGKLVLQKSAGNKNDGHIELNIENLSLGLYVLKYSINGTSGCIKFVKQ